LSFAKLHLGAVIMDKKPDAAQEVRQTLMTLRIIVFSLAMGVSIFLGYTLTMDADAAEAGNAPGLWLYLAIFAGMALMARVVVPQVLFAGIRRRIAHGNWQPATKNGPPAPQTDEGLLMAALQLRTIIGCALLEGAAFANAYAFMVERQVASLAIVLALILMIASHFPLRFWLDGWLERQKRWLDEERSLETVDRTKSL